MKSSPLSYKAFYMALQQYRPTVYDAVPTATGFPPHLRHHAYELSGIFWKIYSEMAGNMHDGATMLDIGAYPGTFLRLCHTLLFKNLDIRYYGSGLILENDEENYREKAKSLPIDFIQSSLSFKEFFRNEGVQFIKLDLDFCFDEKLNLPEGLPKFDVITCMETIEHLHTPYKLMHVIDKLLKPGGICIIETNNVTEMIQLMKLILNKSNLDTSYVERFERTSYSPKRPHVRYYSLDEIAYLFDHIGLTVEKRYTFTPKTPWAYMHLREKIRKSIDAPFPGKKSHILLRAKRNI